MRHAVVVGAALLFLLAAMAFKGALLSLPPVRGTPVADGSFDTGRALARLGRILGDERPHPVDSGANDAVRARLLAEMRAIGLAPSITDDLSCSSSPTSRTVKCARVRNVLATIGPERGRHVLVVSHYDSTPVGPGAADDGIGVAVMLETAAVLRRQNLKHPVAFLFDEGEEAGLLGARAFLARNPLADRVGALVNLESRGVSGPATMFETSQPNGVAIGHFARAVTRSSANSLATDFARMIPNSTDVEVLKERGWTTLNFAIIGNETRYHSSGDTLAALDPRSVQHMGDQALGVVADLASGRAAGSAGQKIYADFLGRGPIVLDQTVGLGALWLLLLAAAIVTVRRRRGAGRAVGAVLIAFTGAAALTFAVQALIGGLRPGEFWRAYPLGLGSAVDAAALLAGIATFVWASHKVQVDRLRASFWLIFLLFGAGISAPAPGASIFFLAPPALALLGMAGERRVKGAERVAAWAAAILLFLTWAPLLAQIEMLLDFDAAWIFAPVAAIVLMPALIELSPLLRHAPRAAFATAGASLLTAGAVTTLLPAYSPDRKQQFGIEYVWDQASGQARWMVVNDGAPLPEAFGKAGPWSRGAEVAWSSRERWSAPAAGAAVHPQIELLSRQTGPGGRDIGLRLRMRGAETLMLQAPADAALRSVRVGGETHRFGTKREEDAPYTFRCNGRSCDGLEITLSVADRRALDLELIGISSGLPPAGTLLLNARPANAAPQYNPDATIAVNRVRL